nr:phosphopantetheine-binding protein [Fischerella thermalis]
MPLTPNGKVNLQALPAPEQQTPEIASAFIAPETTVEKQLATIWAQVLGREKVGIKDNFFALGGDSILSLQVVSKAREAGLKLTPKQIFIPSRPCNRASSSTVLQIPNQEYILTNLAAS